MGWPGQRAIGFVIDDRVLILIFIAGQFSTCKQNSRGRGSWTYRDMREKGAYFLRIIRFLSRSFLCQHMASGEVMRKALRRGDGDTFLHVLRVFCDKFCI
jgi:hypothetical protein